jgi:hypothetical protein
VRRILFQGEESGRFAKFAVAVIRYIGKNLVEVELEGREPLTSRVVNIKGILSDALLNGYRRSVVIKESGTGFTYWAGGTNSTSAIATTSITFVFEENELEKLEKECIVRNEYIPTLISSENFSEDWVFVDQAPNAINEENAERLIRLLETVRDPNLLREVALGLRLFADFLSLNIRLQRKCEKVVLAQLRKLTNEESFFEAKIALVELIGYVGTDASIEVLKNLVYSKNIHPHIIWASVIALGRLPSVDVDEILTNKIQEVDSSNRNAETRDEVLDSEWVVAALLLCLARRVNESTSAALETIFSSRVNSPNKVLQRYACLGLSRLYFYSENTVDLLLNGLRNSNSEVELGYYAMALANSFKPEILKSVWNNDRLLQLTSILGKKLAIFSDSCSEPDKVWGLEYLADLASFLENNALASKFHIKLSDIFDDWRSYYYHSLSSYESGEDFIKEKNISSAKRKFSDSLIAIGKICDSSEYVSSIVQFRKDYINSRLLLLDIFNKWSRTIDPDDIRQLEDELWKKVIHQFQKYSLGIDEASTFERLSVHERNSLIENVSKREKENLSKTIEILEVFKSILRFQQMVITSGIESKETDNYLQTIRIVLNSMYNRNDFLRGQQAIIESLRKKISEIDNILDGDDVYRVKYTNTLNCFTDIINLFLFSSWPMPSHMCMLGGLGRGQIVVRRERIIGEGNEKSPYLFDTSFPIVINIVVTILEMSTGGSTKASLICELPNNEKLRHELPIVEGSTIESFVIPPNIISSYSSTRLDFILFFSTADVTQESTRVTVFIRRNVD